MQMTKMEKMTEIVERGRASAMAVFEHVNTAVPTDRIVPARALQFLPAPEGVHVAYRDARPVKVDGGELASLLTKPLGSGATAERFTKHSFGQVCARAELPVPYASRLNTSEWGRDLLAHNLTELYSHDKNKYLTRSYRGELKGFLSDSYRRLDSRPLLESFAAACAAVGAVPISGHVTDTRVALKVVIPEIFEIAGDPVLIGLQWQNSDFGNGAHELRAIVIRLWCANGATMEDCLRQVHLGRRLSEDMQFSQRTYELDTAASASALDDVVRKSLSADVVAQRVEILTLAHEQKIDPKAAEVMLKKQIGTEDSVRVLEAFRSADTQNMPAGDTQWRLSNAVSWIAGQTADQDRKLDLQRFAGQLLQAA